MAVSTIAKPLIEQAAHLVAYWEDLRTSEPHELRAHLTFNRMLVAVYEATGKTGDWFLRTEFIPVPIRKEPLTVVFLVGPVGDRLRATMREGAEHDMDQYYSPAELRKQLQRGDLGILGSWAPWVNAYFLNAIRDALFGITYTNVRGAVWEHADTLPAPNPVSAARVAIESAAAHIPAFWPMPETLVKSMESRLDAKVSDRTRMIWRRVAQLDLRIPPQNIPRDALRGRSPPPEIPHKGNALTLTEQVTAYLHNQLGMGFATIAEALEMDDWRQAHDAATKAQEKRARWKRLARKSPGGG